MRFQNYFYLCKRTVFILPKLIFWVYKRTKLLVEKLLWIKTVLHSTKILFLVYTFDVEKFLGKLIKKLIFQFAKLFIDSAMSYTIV